MAFYLIQCSNPNCGMFHAKETNDIKKYIFRCRSCGIKKRCYYKRTGTQMRIKPVSDGQFAKELVKECNKELLIKRNGLMDLGFNVVG